MLWWSGCFAPSSWLHSGYFRDVSLRFVNLGGLLSSLGCALKISGPYPSVPQLSAGVSQSGVAALLVIFGKLLCILPGRLAFRFYCWWLVLLVKLSAYAVLPSPSPRIAADAFREPSLAELESESFSRRLRSLMFDTNSVGDDSNCHHLGECSFHHCASSGCCVF